MTAATAAPVSTAFTREEELHWIALHLTPGLGPRRAMTLLERFRTPEGIFRASAGELEGAGVGGAAAQSIASGCIFEEAVAQQQLALEVGAIVIPLASSHYPQRLRGIYDPPVLLFVRGRVELLNAVNVAIVGTRRPSAYGNAAAERVARELAEAGVCVVSGMARGIDTKAHQAALAAGGDTVAVFGCGVDVVYPVENRQLAAEISRNGLLVSEFGMGTPGYPQNFPIRNRVVSGISAGVVVVEGAQYSGSTITAKLASDQGREVFAVPGNITSPMSWAPNLLIKQGAKLVQEWNDVVAELPEEDRSRLAARHRLQLSLLESGEPAKADETKPLPGPPDPSARIRSALQNALAFDKPIHLDHLMEVLEGHSASELIAALFDMELLGLVRQLPGKHYIKVWVD